MGNELNSSRLRFGPIAVAAAALGLALGLAMPVSPVSAGVRSDATAAAPAKQALPSEAAKTDGVIVVAGKDKNKNWNKSYNKNWNKHYYNKKVVVVRPYRKWNRRPYYGTVIGGVALGTILGAAAYSAAAPAPNTCWYWADPSMTRGYWDYC
jgi:hypothetical protein